MQAADNYSDFVEERSAGVIVVLAERRERRERRTALSLSHATELLTAALVCTCAFTHTHTDIITTKAEGRAQTPAGIQTDTHK